MLHMLKLVKPKKNKIILYEHGQRHVNSPNYRKDKSHKKKKKGMLQWLMIQSFGIISSFIFTFHLNHIY